MVVMRHVLLVALWLIALTRLAVAQATGESTPARSDSSAAAFLEETRAGTARYHDRAVAIADGYRRVGPEFPGMGEHWVQPDLVTKASHDARHPAVLIYATAEGKPRLAGVAYVLALSAGEVAPDLPAGRHAWHDHSGTIKESLIHRPSATAHAELTGPAVAVLHAWVWLDNPAGTFAVDNWAIPFARLGLLVPTPVPESAAKALSLADGSLAYYDELLSRMASNGEGVKVMRQRLREAHASVEREIGSNAANGTLQVAALSRLAGIWEQLWCDLYDVAPDSTRGIVTQIQPCLKP